MPVDKPTDSVRLALMRAAIGGTDRISVSFQGAAKLRGEAVQPERTHYLKQIL